MSEATLTEPAVAPSAPAAAAQGPIAPAKATPSPGSERPPLQPNWKVGFWFFISLLGHLSLVALPCLILAGLGWAWYAHQRQLDREEAQARQVAAEATQAADKLQKDLGAQITQLRQQLQGVEAQVKAAARPEDVGALEAKLESRLAEVGGAIGGVKTLSERMQPEAPYPPAPPQVGCDVMVVALNSRRLDIKQFVREFQTLRGNAQLARTYYPRYRLAVSVVTTNEWEPLVSFDSPTFPAEVFRPLDGSDATERIDEVAARLPEVFPKGGNPTRRCVLLVSSECSAPQRPEAWAGLAVDAILIGKPAKAEVAQAWQKFCDEHQGKLCFVQTVAGDNAEARERVNYYLRLLTHPLVVFANT
jgi:hypothetical protein